MKKHIKSLLFPLLALTLMITACSKWTDMEIKETEDMLNSNKSEAYYKALREYKKTDHAVAFGWFGNWTAKGSNLKNCLVGLPDSVDIVSLWSGWSPSSITPEKRRDLDFVQKIKGTKVLGCSFTANVGDGFTPSGVNQNEYWGWDNSDKEKQEAAIRKYAQVIIDSINAAGLDGLDIDHEPNYGSAGNLSSYKERMHIFITELGKHLGPMSGTDKLLTVDGEPHFLLPESGPYVSYFIEQTYYASSDWTLDKNRISKCFNNYRGILAPEEIAARYIATENFEDLALLGGTSYTDNEGNRMRSLEGFARWNPTYEGKKYRKGGVGTYHMEYEYHVPGSHQNITKYTTYPALRAAIQIMNPSNN